MSAHIYGAGTRLSTAYTMGCDGLPFAPHLGTKSSAAFKAWKEGRDSQRSALTRINEQLKRQSVPFRLVRGRGYYYLQMLEGAPSLPSDSIATYRIEPSDYGFAARSVAELLAAGGIHFTI